MFADREELEEMGLDPDLVADLLLQATVPLESRKSKEAEYVRNALESAAEQLEQ